MFGPKLSDLTAHYTQMDNVQGLQETVRALDRALRRANERDDELSQQLATVTTERNEALRQVERKEKLLQQYDRDENRFEELCEEYKTERDEAVAALRDIAPYVPPHMSWSKNEEGQRKHLAALNRAGAVLDKYKD